MDEKELLSSILQAKEKHEPKWNVWIHLLQESLSERSVAIGKLIQDKKHGSFEANLGRGVQLCEQSSEGILSTLSGQIGLLQQIHLPPTCRASSRAESSVSISLPQV